MPTEIRSEAEFDAQLTNAGPKLVVVDFHATWCGPCHAIAPTFSSLATQYAASAVFLKVDVDANKGVAGRYAVRAMPTFVFIKAGRVVETLRGADPGRLKEFVRTHATGGGGAGAAFSGAGSTLGGSGSSSSAGRGSTSATPRTAPGSNVHGFGARNVQLETVLPFALLGAYLVYILFN